MFGRAGVVRHLLRVEVVNSARSSRRERKGKWAAFRIALGSDRVACQKTGASQAAKEERIQTIVESKNA